MTMVMIKDGIEYGRGGCDMMIRAMGAYNNIINL